MRPFPHPRRLAPWLALALIVTALAAPAASAATGCVNLRAYTTASTTDVVFQLSSGIGVIASARDPSQGVTLGVIIIPDLCRADSSLRDTGDLVHATHTTAQGALPMLP